MDSNSRTIIFEFVRYGVISAIALAIDFSCLFVLSKYIHYLVAASISFLLGGVLAYYLSVKYVFKHHRFGKPTAEMICFLVIGIVGLVINGLVIGVLVQRWSVSLMLAKTFAAGCTFLTNFTLRKSLLFAGRKLQHQQPKRRPYLS